ncbi:4'-phosphopantetheinyl transferase family protein [Rugamonas brunnea]|uniref:4'-phosphopantetheinyl transferase family protein n=1 Tax=Rugamonas brunnea TaxID=2758569 RepID=UPI001E2F6576|nr:4'-phosphopantetheinyl transferase superfamily protein [Rugamonas brunnea]
MHSPRPTTADTDWHASLPVPGALPLQPFRLAPGADQLLVRLPPPGLDAAAHRRGAQRRQAEHHLGRRCAARLLVQLGAADTTVGINADRSPRWPRHVVGSITHSRTLVAVALARQSQVRAIGIDAEPIVAAADLEAIEHLCLTPRERQTLEEQSQLPRHMAVTAIFSAKEALYKCLYPLVQRYFDFQCAQIDLTGMADGVIHARLLHTLSPEFCAGYTITGSYLGQLDHTFTAFCLTW